MRTMEDRSREESAMLRRFVVALTLVVAPLAVVPASPASAIGFTVNSNGDGGDLLPGNGTCATLTNVCTLRAAVQEANALGGADVITVPAMTIGLGSPLTFSSNVTVQGAGARTTILQATGGAHGMLVVPSGVVTLRGFTVTGATGIGALGISQSGGDLTIDGVRFTGNVASTAGGGYGPVYSTGGTMDLRNSEISGNSTTSTSTNGWGGGLAVYSATVTVTNTTITGNTVAGPSSAVGGGVWAGMDSNVTITSSTIANNTVTSPIRYGAGIYQTGSGTGSIEVADSILAGPQGAPNCSAVGKVPVFIARNLIDDTSCGTASATRTIGAAGLSALTNNGGQTDTRIPAAPGPAINAASACATPTDQRGQARPIGSACDLGAAEVGADREASVAVSNSNPSPGSDIVVTASVRNKGLDISTGTQVVVTTAGASQILSATAPGGGCSIAGDSATCAAGAVVSGGTSQVVLSVRMPSSGTVNVTATVNGDQPDPVGTNNAASASASTGGVDASGVCSAVRNGTKKANVLRGTGASDRINGKGGNDRINGKGGIDCLDGGPGKDRITGGAGRDRITAGAGNDRVFVKDGATDRVNCGKGRDRVIADPKDKLTKCEIVRRP